MYSSLVFFGACSTWIHEIFHDEIEPKEKKYEEKKNPLLEKEKGGITKGKQPNNHNTTKERPQ